jgi:RNA-dependent RNA polymerase
MRLNASSLFHETKRQLTKDWEDGVGAEKALAFAWSAWQYSATNRSQFGANSFGLVALCVIFDALDAIATIQARETAADST